MKSGLPNEHGLVDNLVASDLVYRGETGEIELTDAQFAALQAGVARGESVLALAPTSSGKTAIGLFAAASWLQAKLADGGRAVFLTSHRALARQKFQELLGGFATALGLEPTELVLATGDDVTDGMGDAVADAMAAPVLVCTYEKYLNMLSGAGLEGATDNVCCIADEIQLVIDATRGANVEILLTLLKRKVGQLVGLSAVLDRRDADELASWLGCKLIYLTDREIPLRYELRAHNATYMTATDVMRDPEMARVRTRGTIHVLRELLANPEEHEPIAVFCMTKKQVFDLAAQWASAARGMGADVLEDLPLFREQTTAAEELGRYLPQRFAYHTADLNEDERIAVEAKLDGNELKVIFATTTLAAGLNYSFKTVIIHAWRRYNKPRRSWEPISRGEFHNMAGRAGRLSRVDKCGRVIFFAEDAAELRAAPRYLSWWELDSAKPQIAPSGFPQLCLQLLAAGVAKDEDELIAFMQETYSAHHALERDAFQREAWSASMQSAVEDLKNWRFVS